MSHAAVADVGVRTELKEPGRVVQGREDQNWYHVEPGLDVMT